MEALEKALPDEHVLYSSATGEKANEGWGGVKRGGKRGGKKGTSTETGLAVEALQKALPDAHVLYSSATGEGEGGGRGGRRRRRKGHKHRHGLHERVGNEREG